MKAAFSSAVDCDSTRQQHQQDQIEQQRNTSDDPPGEQRVAHGQWRCRRPLERSVGAALECQQEFFGSLEALAGVFGDRFAEGGSWPDLGTCKLRQRR